MDYDILHRIFNHTKKFSNPVEAGSLSGVYRKLDAAKQAEDALMGALSKLDLSFEMDGEIGCLCSDFSNAYEEQGFINGVLLGVRLAGELGVSPELDKEGDGSGKDGGDNV